METGKSERIGWGHHTIYTDIEIDAAPDVVWAVLTDTASYDKWAVFIVGIKGEIADGATITVDFQLDPNKEKRIIVDHRISVVDGQEFFWAEKGPGAIRDNHHFRVEARDDSKSSFVHSDEIRGGVTYLMGGRLAKTYVDGYQQFNRALKAEAERRTHATE